MLTRASFGTPITEIHQNTTIEPVTEQNGLVTRSRRKLQRSVGKVALPRDHKKDTSLPAAHDSQGRALFIRASDSKLVYLRCCVAGCDRTSFASVKSLRRHVSAARFRHKIKGVFSSDSHAIELCGEVAPGQGGFGPKTALQSNCIPDANITPPIILDTSTGRYNTHDRKDGLSSGSSSVTLVGPEDGVSVLSTEIITQDLRAHRNKSIIHGGGTETRNGRALEAAESYGGYSSSDSEEDKEGGFARSIPTANIDRHAAAFPPHTSGKQSFTGSHLRDMCSIAEQQIQNGYNRDNIDPIVKEEDAATPSIQLKRSNHFGTWAFLAPSAARNCPAPDNGNKSKGHGSTKHLATDRKRTASQPPCTPLPLHKRFRHFEAPSSI